MSNLVTHKDLEVWKKSINFVTKIYGVTSTFPKDEVYGIVNQIRRAAVSIPSNIAEGAARNHDKEFIQFLSISLGSISELETQIIISNNLKYLTDIQSEEIINHLVEIRKMLIGLVKNIEKKTK